MTEERYKVAIYDEKAINGYCVLDLEKPSQTARLKYENVFISTKEGCNIVCELLNDQDGEIKKLQKIGQEIFEWDSKRCIHILEAMQKFARQYSHDSIEFNLLYELGKELPINPNYLWPKEAFEDEEVEE